MDSTDYKILNILQQNGRISMSKLAKEVSLSIPSTIERVKKMEESGIILGYSAKINPSKLGRNYNAIVLSSATLENRDKCTKLVTEDSRVVQAYRLTGRFTGCMKISCENEESFLDLLNKFYTFGIYETYMIVDTIKDNSIIK